jgi:threonine dehydrogenase-like Zn-dependent dehydrogenase
MRCRCWRAWSARAALAAACHGQTADLALWAVASSAAACAPVRTTSCVGTTSTIITSSPSRVPSSGSRSPVPARGDSRGWSGSRAARNCPLRGARPRPHGVELPGEEMFFSHVRLHGGPAPVRQFLPELIELIWNRTIDPGKVFDLELPLDQAAEGYKAMDERRAIKVLLRP